MSDLTLEQRAIENPWGLVMEALGYETRGEPCPEELQEAVTHAVGFLVALAFREFGMDEEKILDLICDREYEVKLSYNFETSECECGILWGDGTTTNLTGKGLK